MDYSKMNYKELILEAKKRGIIYAWREGRKTVWKEKGKLAAEIAAAAPMPDTKPDDAPEADPWKEEPATAAPQAKAKAKTTTTKTNTATERTETMGSLEKAIKENADHLTALEFKNDHGRDRSASSRSWYGMDACKPSEVINAIHRGYSQGLEAIRAASGHFEIAPIKSVRRRQRIRGDQGDDLDIMRVYAGNIDRAWTRTQKAGGGGAYGKHIKIACDIGGNCGMNADAMKWRGAYAAALADRYAEAGYSVELYAYAAVNNLGYNSGNGLNVIVKLLDSAEPYDLEKLANTISFPGFFRTLIFEALITIPEKASDVLGQHNANTPKELKEAVIIKDIWSLEDVKKHKLPTEA